MTKTPLNTDRKTVRRVIYGTRICYICPKCGQPVRYRKKMHHNLCMRCGQYLSWGDYEEMPAVFVTVGDSGEAGYWAERYEQLNGTLYGIDPEAFRLSRRSYPADLYFPFTDPKAYGKFMRIVAKERIFALR